MLTWWFCHQSRIAPMCLLGIRRAEQKGLPPYGLWAFSWYSLSAYRKSVAKNHKIHTNTAHTSEETWNWRVTKTIIHDHFTFTMLSECNIVWFHFLHFILISQHVASTLHSTSWSHDNQWWSVFQFTYMNWTIVQSNSQVGVADVNAPHIALELQDVFGSSTFHHVPAELICFFPACLRKKKTSDKKSKWESILRTLRLKL